MIDRPPQVDHLTIQLHVHLVQMPTPVAKATHPAHPLLADIAGEEWSKPVPPEAHGLVADVDPPLEQQVLYDPHESGKRTYISTTNRITSGDELK
jgi:hypothetical protein